jgi:hypothetical protein
MVVLDIGCPNLRTVSAFLADGTGSYADIAEIDGDAAHKAYILGLREPIQSSLEEHFSNGNSMDLSRVRDHSRHLRFLGQWLGLFRQHMAPSTVIMPF